MRKMKNVFADSKFQYFKRFEILVENQNQIRGGTTITNTDVVLAIVNDDLDNI